MSKHTSEALESGYALSHRIYELSGIAATALTGAWLCARLSSAGPMPLWWFPVALVLGMVGADLVSGVVHWGFDTFGDVDTPVVGKLAIRTFRHHHVDPTAMLKHDFIETNGHNVTLSLVLTTTGLWLVPSAGAASRGALFGAVCMVTMAIFVSITSQIHKWAHMASPPRLVRRLQRMRVILSPDHHDRHHAAPHRENYCIALGWLDGTLRRTRIFEHTERLIQAITGVAPQHSEPDA